MNKYIIYIFCVYKNFVIANKETVEDCMPTKQKFRIPWESVTKKNEIIGEKKHPYLIKETQQIPIHRNVRKSSEN